MFFIAIGIALTIILSIVLKGNLKKLAFLALIICLFGCMVSIPTGYTGVITVFGKVKDRTLEAGMHFIPPWYQIVKIDNRTQRQALETEAFSSDIQQVNIEMSVNYCIDKDSAQELYRTVGKEYYEKVLYPRVLECTKACFSQYTAESLVANRGILSENIMKELSEDMKVYGIQVTAVSLEDIDFTDAFTDAVESKQVAEQNKLKAAIEQEQKTIEAEAEAQRAVMEAEAKLEVAKLEAEANLALDKSFTDKLLTYYYIQAWNGELPKVVGQGYDFMITME